MTQHSDNFASLVDLDPVLAEIFYQSYQQFSPILLPAVYAERNSMKAKETDQRIGSLGEPQPWAGQVHYDEADNDYQVVYTHDEYTLGFKVTQQMFEDNQYSGIFENASDLGQSFMRKVLKLEASTFQNAFSASYVGYDSVALCSASHPRGKTDATTVSNYLGAVPLTDTNLENAIVQLEELGDDKGQVTNAMGTLLVVGRNYRKKARELIDSEYAPESAENAINVHTDMRYLVHPYVTGHKWFVIDEMMSRQKLKWYWRVRPTYDGAFDAGNTLVRSFYGRMRASTGWSDWRFCVGSNLT